MNKINNEINFLTKIFTKKITLLYVISIMFTQNSTFCRSRLRKSEEKKPRIEVCREKTKKKTYFISSQYLEEEALFKTFDKDFFYNTLLPMDKITYRYDKSKSITGKELSDKLENLIIEISKRKRKYKDFKILKQEDFNRRHKSGLIILKFKDLPFVVKVFIESPKSFTKPYSKGLIPTLFFNINGGLGRFFLGFTRIKNLYNIKEKIQKDPKWSNQIEFPRKWHWIPKNPKNIKITGKNFKKDGSILEVVVPGAYCIIADEIKLKDKSFSVFNKKEREECMSLCNFLDVCVDPHIDNFMLEQGSEKIALIDTENFRTVVGLKGKYEFDGYVSWIYNVAIKAIQDIFLRTKYQKS